MLRDLVNQAFDQFGSSCLWSYERPAMDARLSGPYIEWLVGRLTENGGMKAYDFAMTLREAAVKEGLLGDHVTYAGH